MPTAKEAIQELLEMSTSIRHAVLVRGENEVMASTFANSQSEGTMVAMARRMLEEARMSAKEMDRPALTQVFVEAKSGCVFIVTGEKDTWLAASTGTDPTVGLVLYDVNTALRTALEGEADEGDYGK
ncbi:MAG: roadblock/LC7 domain-containing protein [Thermoleophilia bacterium]|nr:roadblock/LC7 domain-containing protein [Thermoleophilia bacterium]